MSLAAVRAHSLRVASERNGILRHRATAHRADDLVANSIDVVVAAISQPDWSPGRRFTATALRGARPPAFTSISSGCHLGEM
jgi:hypothetical protein